MKEVVNNMRKLTTVFVLIIIGLTLVACGSDEPKDIEVTVIDLTVESSEMIAEVIVTEDFKELSQLEEIAYNVSSQLYEENFEMIGASSYTLIINFYDSQSSFDAEDVTYGTIIFDVNKSMENPGLSLNQNQLSID
jgi:uncharacterized protein YcfL